MLRQVAEGVLIHQSELLQNNAVVGKARPACCSSTPGYAAPKWFALRTTFASWASPLWQASRRILIGITCSGTPNLASAPLRYSPRRGLYARFAVERGLEGPRRRGVTAGTAEEIPLDLFGLITGLPDETAQIPWDGPTVRIIEHSAHAQGHAALLIEERGVLVAGDMLSDILIPFPDLDAANPIEDYLVGLRLLEGVADDVDVHIPGHGSVGGADLQVRARIQSKSSVRACLA